jgi:repressor LexA
MPQPALTRRQLSLHQYLIDRQSSGEPPPSIQQACLDLGLASRGSLHKQVLGLVDAGLVEPLEGKQRGIRLIDPTANRPRVQRLPILGRIAAGRPIEAITGDDDIDVPERMSPRGDGYVLKVRGDSMIDAGILDGDLVIIDPAPEPRRGDIVVALIDGHEATLKRYERRQDEIWLHAENAEYPVQRFPTRRVQIQGVLIGQMRVY